MLTDARHLAPFRMGQASPPTLPQAVPCQRGASAPLLLAACILSSSCAHSLALSLVIVGRRSPARERPQARFYFRKSEPACETPCEPAKGERTVACGKAGCAFAAAEACLNAYRAATATRQAASTAERKLKAWRARWGLPGGDAPALPFDSPGLPKRKRKKR